MKHLNIHTVSQALGTSCGEISFCIEGMPEYSNCYMGVILIDGKDVYWLGLVPNGSQAYDFHSKEELFNAPVFNGKSLKEIWPNVLIDIEFSPQVEIE